MKVIYNSLIPFKGFVAINLFGIVFARKEYKELSKRTINHEAIHTRQQVDCLALFFIPYVLLAVLYSWWWLLFWPLSFYILYLAEWGISYFYHRIRHINRTDANMEAYTTSAMEMEAKAFESDPNYLTQRFPLSWFKYYGRIE